jgi:Na+-driven multidrug efflux pump
MIMMTVISLVIMLVMQIFGGAITSLFIPDPEVIKLGAMGLRMTSMFYLALGIIYVVRGVLTGVGDAFFALFNGIIEVIGRFTLPILITEYMGYGIRGIWISAGLVWLVSGITAWMRYENRLHSSLFHFEKPKQVTNKAVL